MGIDGAPLDDLEALGDQRLDPDIVGARSDGALNLRLEPRLELFEQRVLQPDAQRQHAVEEAGDRRQVFLQAAVLVGEIQARVLGRSEEHTSELQSLMRISYAVFCLKKKKKYTNRRAKH